MSGLFWSEAELATLRGLFGHATWPEIIEAMPGRTRSSINCMARGLALTRKVSPRKPWTQTEIANLQRLYSRADQREIEAALPGRNFGSIGKKAASLGIRRVTEGTRTNRRFIHPIIQKLRQARDLRRLSRAELSNLTGYHVNNILAWELGKSRPLFSYVADLAEALGFKLVLQKVVRTEDEVIAWPDRKQLMSGR